MDQSSRVGIRQWRALNAVAAARPALLSVRDLRHAVARSDIADYGQNVAETLLTHRLLAHGCHADDHEVGKDCLIRITERGLDAKANKHALKVMRERR